MLNSKEKVFLKKYANSNKILKFNIGKDLIDDNVIDMLSNALTKYELIKVNFLKTSIETKTMEEQILDLSSKLHCDIVSKVGRVALIYKENKKSAKHIKIHE